MSATPEFRTPHSLCRYTHPAMNVLGLTLVGTLIWNRPALFAIFAVVSAAGLITALVVARVSPRTSREPNSPAWTWTAITIDFLGVAGALVALYPLISAPAVASQHVVSGPHMATVACLVGALLIASLWVYAHIRSDRPVAAPAAPQ
ncbi:hypothetical protein ACFWPQ_25285 [Streptomyces sp. NPDC058464]|uniref:hypothetical protein n=1 Tax=Streptomyces sp. NPDC058464 TaxID=3346511 RepID=UPI003648702C